MATAHPYSDLECKMDANGASCTYYDIQKLGDKVKSLPFCIRVILESAVRNCDGQQLTKANVDTILNWQETSKKGSEVSFNLARVILQDFTGVPCVVDLAAMRDAVKRLGGDPAKINPHVPVDLVIDHSVQVDKFGSHSALKANMDREFERNEERFQFLKWGSQSFDNMQIVPPGAGIVHQVNLEYLARVVFNKDGKLYPDSLVGTDSHTPMVNGLGVLGWGVGGIEAEAAMLGVPLSVVLPEVVGYKLTGTLPSGATATDLVLTIVKNLRDLGVVGKFVEFFGPGTGNLSIADRATISNMAPEYGATVGYFPVDQKSIDYLRVTGRDDAQIARVEQYLKAQGMFRHYDQPAQDPVFSHTLELDLSTIVPAMAGPKRPHDFIPLTGMKSDFEKGLVAPVSFKGFGLSADQAKTTVPFTYQGKDYQLTHGSVAIAAITSCTNTSNPSVMLAAGLLAQKAHKLGLTIDPYIKTSLAPGSGVVTEYLSRSGLDKDLESLGFYTVGYGCTTCIGNSGPLPEPVAEAVEKGDLVAAGVLSGNRNFEGRIHPHVRANYLASPPLVVAYALAGRVTIDFETEPLGQGSDGKDVFLRDIWPQSAEIQQFVEKFVVREMFMDTYKKVTKGTAQWNALKAEPSPMYQWQASSTYIHHPPFFQTMGRDPPAALPAIEGARCLGLFGDSITTDHISPAGNISRKSPAARYLEAKGVAPKDFNSYGSRRGNDEVMARGTFANIRLLNQFIGKAAPKTLHHPSGEVLDVFDAAEKYQKEGTPLIILAGAMYGTGSSRDWAAKGVWMQGVKAVVAVSYERIHRSNLVLFGVLPLEFLPGQSPASLKLDGTETFAIDQSSLTPGGTLSVSVSNSKNGVTSFDVRVRIDTSSELTYYKNGGVLNHVIRQSL